MAEHVELGSLTGAERVEAAQHFVVIAKKLTSLARIFDPSVKLSAPKGKKAAVDPNAPPKPKRALNAYTTFIKENLSDYKKEVRSGRVVTQSPK
jgi:transcription termination factor Rho